MSSIREIAKQQEVAKAALSSGAISQSEYNAFIQDSSRRIVEMGKSGGEASLSPSQPWLAPDVTITGVTKLDKGFQISYVKPEEQTATKEAGAVPPLTPAPSRAYSISEFGTGELSDERIKELHSAYVAETQRESLLVLGGGAALLVAPQAALIGAGIGLGVGEALQFVPSNPVTGEYKGKFLSTSEAFESALTGAAFSVVGAGTFRALGYAGKALGVGLPSGAKGVATSVFGRASVNAALSGSTSYVASGFDVESGVKGAAFGALFSFVMEPVNVGISKVAPKFFGKQFYELTSVKESYAQLTSGKKTVITRVTLPEINKVVLHGQEAKYYTKYNLGTLEKPVLDLAGKQRVRLITDEGGLQEVTTFPTEKGLLPKLKSIEDINKAFPKKTLNEFSGEFEPTTISRGKYSPSRVAKDELTSVTSTRSAESLKMLLKGENVNWAKVVAGNLNSMLKSPSQFSAVEKVTLKSAVGKVYEEIPFKVPKGSKVRAGETPLLVSEKTVVTGEAAILPKQLSAFRKFSAVKLRGKVPVESDVTVGKKLSAELAQDAYKKLGGGTKPKPFGDVGDLKPETKNLMKGLPDVYDLSDLKGAIGRPIEGLRVTMESPVKTVPVKPVVEKVGMKPLGNSKGYVKPEKLIEKQFLASQTKTKEPISVRDYIKMTRESKAMKKGSNEFFRQGRAAELSKRYIKSPPKSALLLKQLARNAQIQSRAKSKEITLPRAIIGVAPKERLFQPSFYPAGQKQEVEEMQVVSYPSTGEPKSASVVLPGVKSELKGDVAQRFIVELNAELEQRQATYTPTVVKSGTVQGVGVVSLVKSASSSRLAPFVVSGRGGGSERSVRKRSGGVWFRRTHAIPSPKQVLKQVLKGRRVKVSLALKKKKRKR